MAIEVYDAREDHRNIFVSTHVRVRYLRMAPGAVAERHSHDLGHEVFLVLEGRIYLEVEGERAELAPGQSCVVRADRVHQVSVAGDEPALLFLTMSPHVHPTHTPRDRDGERGALRFLPPATYGEPEESRLPVDEVIDQVVDLSEQLAAEADKTAQEQRMAGARLSRALASRNLDNAERQREIMWFAIYRVFDKAYQLAAQWNRLAPRAGRTQ